MEFMFIMMDRAKHQYSPFLDYLCRQMIANIGIICLTMKLTNKLVSCSRLFSLTAGRLVKSLIDGCREDLDRSSASISGYLFR